MPARRPKSNCCGRSQTSKIRFSAPAATILAIGVLEDQLKLRHPELKIAATNVGSLGGLLALQRSETHMAGTHLLDPETGVYNIPDIKRTIPKVPVVLVHLAEREQGILVARGNPQSIAQPQRFDPNRRSFRQPPAGFGHAGVA